MVTDQEQGPGLKGIDGIFDGIVDLAREQQDDLVKVMKVKAPFLPGRIPEVEIVIVLVKVALFIDLCCMIQVEASPSKKVQCSPVFELCTFLFELCVVPSAAQRILPHFLQSFKQESQFTVFLFRL